MSMCMCMCVHVDMQPGARLPQLRGGDMHRRRRDERPRSDAESRPSDRTDLTANGELADEDEDEDEDEDKIR